MRTIVTPTNKNVKPTYLEFDNLDDRREIYHLLGKLSPMRRIEFMQWFLSQAHLGPWPTLKPVVAPETIALARQAVNDDAAADRLALTLYIDIFSVASSYENLTLDLAFNHLVEMVKNKS